MFWFITSVFCFITMKRHLEWNTDKLNGSVLERSDSCILSSYLIDMQNTYIELLRENIRYLKYYEGTKLITEGQRPKEIIAKNERMKEESGKVD